MSRILFADTSHPKAYGFDDLAAHAMGGTESSVLRTAKILSKHKHTVSIYQQHRERHEHQQGVNFIGPAQLAALEAPDHVVVLRKFPQLRAFQQQFPQAQTHLWIHTYKNWEYVLKRGVRMARPWQLIGNSHTHAADCDRLLHQGLLGRMFNVFKPRIPISTCYNPIPAALADHPPQARDPNKLLFLSAPNKGLAQVLASFQQLNQLLPELQLYVANPGSREDQPESLANVHYLGALPADEVKQHLATSLCVFYPQDSFAETFGLIYAEANALGTPVLAHDIGAAREILHPNNPLINAQDLSQITHTIQTWQQALPQVSYRPEFDEPAIYQQWVEALGLG